MSTRNNLNKNLNGLEGVNAQRVPLWRYFANPALLIGLVLFLGLILAVLLGPIWGMYDPYLVAQSTRPYYDSDLKEMVSPPFEP